jgi:hypothetical protein
VQHVYEIHSWPTLLYLPFHQAYLQPSHMNSPGVCLEMD